MFLDIRSLMVATIAVCCVLGPVSLAFGIRQPHMRPARFWGAALIALAGGLALTTLRAGAADFLSEVAGPALLALALALAARSARALQRERRRDVLGGVLLVVFFVALLALQAISADLWLRYFLVAGLLGFQCCRVAQAFDAGGALREGRPIRVIAILFIVLGFSLALHGALTAAGERSGVAPEARGLDALMAIGLMAALLIGTITLMWVMIEQLAARIRSLAARERLTGVLNRQAFAEAFKREQARVQRRAGSRFALLALDLDGFRRINDAYGHGKGDHLLAAVAEVLRGTAREYDLIGRLEGDVFVMLLPGTLAEGALAAAERARVSIEREAGMRAGLRRPVPVTVSVGVAVFGEHGDDWGALIRAAEAGVRDAKVRGGNRAALAFAARQATSAISS